MSSSDPLADPDAEGARRPWLAGTIVGGIAAMFLVAFLGLPRGHDGLPAIARHALLVAIPQWKTTQAVSEVVYGTRGTDTFGETFLLLAAVVSVTLITRRREPRHGFVGESRAGEREQREEDPSPGPDPAQTEARSAEQAEDDPGSHGSRAITPDGERLGTPSPERAQEMTVVTRVAVRIAVPVLTVAGFYLVAQGYSPGGGFPAGAVIFGVVLLVYVAFGYQRIARVVRPGIVETLELAGAFAIIAIETLGLVLRGSFSANWIPLAPLQTLASGGVLQAFSVAEFVEVGTGLTLIVFSLLGMRHDWTPDDDSDEGSGP